MMRHPMLYHKGKNGELRQWKIWTEGDEIVSEYGQVGGQMQIARKTAEPKNLGRSNETTPEEQAMLEAKAMWVYKLERKYSETPEGAQEQLPLPMLAHKFTGTKKKKFSYPGWVQPKLDGVRCGAQNIGGEICLTSRQGKIWKVPHIQEELAQWLPEGIALDGEIYIHGLSCQKITSLVRSAVPGTKSYKPESASLVYHVYDMPVHDNDDSLPWTDRLSRMVAHLQESNHVARVESVLIGSEDEVWTAHGSYAAEGYEGAILRSQDGKYIWGYRSADLLKVKKFQDAEFEVIGAKDGKGKMSGRIIFICRNDLTDGTFDCTMKVTMAERRRMYTERDNYMGRSLTCRFFDRTDAQIPRFPIGIVFRDPKDLPS